MSWLIVKSSSWRTFVFFASLINHSFKHTQIVSRFYFTVALVRSHFKHSLVTKQYIIGNMLTRAIASTIRRQSRTILWYTVNNCTVRIADLTFPGVIIRDIWLERTVRSAADRPAVGSGVAINVASEIEPISATYWHACICNENWFIRQNFPWLIKLVIAKIVIFQFFDVGNFEKKYFPIL